MLSEALFSNLKLLSEKILTCVLMKLGNISVIMFSRLVCNNQLELLQVVNLSMKDDYKDLLYTLLKHWIKVMHETFYLSYTSIPITRENFLYRILTRSNKLYPLLCLTKYWWKKEYRQARSQATACHRASIVTVVNCVWLNINGILFKSYYNY